MNFRPMKTRRALNAVLLAGFAGFALPMAAQAQADWPAKPVTIVMPYPPGGLADASSRRVAHRLSEIWNVSVVVDNKPGAAGLLGASLVAKAPADGYNLLFTIPETLSISKAAGLGAGFDPVDDFQPVSLVALSSTVLTVPVASPHKTFKDFIAFARQNPGKLNFGVQGVGSSFHLALEQLKAMSGSDITAVPYKGAAPAMVDLLAGRIDAMIVSTSVTIPYVQSGKLRVIAMASKERVPQMPDVPAIAESGYPGYDAPVGLGVLVRAGTPKPIVDKLSADLRRVMHEPAMVEWLATVAAVTSNLTPEAFKARMRREVQGYGQLIEKAGIKFE